MQLKLRRHEILKGLQAVCELCKTNFIHFFCFQIWSFVLDSPDNIPTVTRCSLKCYQFFQILPEWLMNFAFQRKSMFDKGKIY